MKSILLLLFSVATLLYQAFVLTALWGWFVVHHFEMAELPLSVAVGILLIYALITIKFQEKEVDMEEYVARIIYSLSAYTIILFTGCIVTLLT